MYKYAVFSLLVVSALAVPAPESNLDCLQKHDDDIFSCVAVKMVSALDRAARSADVHIIDGVTFVRDTPVERSGKSLKTETEILSELPRDMADRTLEIASMIYESAQTFFKSHSLKVNVPEGSVSRALDEARAKGLKKAALPVIAAIAVKLLALAPIFLGGLALLVAKALVVGKIALIIAGILAFQRLFSGGAGVATPFAGGFPGNIFSKNQASGWDQGGWTGGAVASNGGYNYRSFNDKTEAQQLAYSAQAPNETN